MSVLTKVFVVLLVILSLLLSAAAVTFLNTVPTLEDDLASAQESLRIAESTASAANTQAEFARGTANARVAQAETRLTALQDRIDSLRQELQTARAEAADVKGQLALEQATVASTAEALTFTTRNVEALQDRVAQLREENTAAVRRFGDTQAALAQAENELRFARQSLQNEQTKNLELNQQLSQAATVLENAGINLAEAGGRGGAPVNGVIVNRRALASGPVATISVGRQDDVREGQEFAVYDKDNGDFLGVLRVTTVDDQEALGSLRGPGINRIQPDDLVRPDTLN